MKYVSHNLQETAQIARLLSQKIGPNKPLLLNGALGAGKTTLVKAIAKCLGVEQLVTSPTFNKMHLYSHLVHIDAYHLQGDLSAYEEYFDAKPVIIEWSNNLQLNFQAYLKVDVYREQETHIYEIVAEQKCKS